MKTNTIVSKIVILSFITVSIMYAAKLLTLNNTYPDVTYHDMSISELQEKVEVLSQKGDLPFDMGLALIKKWTES